MEELHVCEQAETMYECMSCGENLQADFPSYAYECERCLNQSAE
jgi:DNA-directed RNA polymerase subunit RPC12/RpoP